MRRKTLKETMYGEKRCSLYKNGKTKFYQRLLPKNKIKILNL